MAKPDLKQTDRSRILQLAKQLAGEQGRLGDSPADRSLEGHLHLCAASCVAEAAIRVTGRSSSPADFRARVNQCDKFELLPAVFSDCGLNPEVAIALIKENDSRSGQRRLSWFNSVAQLD